MARRIEWIALTPDVERGFTLTEVMFAIAIVAIVAALAYPAYQNAVRKARRAEARATLWQVMEQEERFYTQNAHYVAFSAESNGADEKSFSWYSGSSPSASAYEIAGEACSGDTIANCVLLTARPGTRRVNAAYSDPECGVLTLSSSGAKGASGDIDRCWQ
jgi:type IV pilus assembly protein PilE